MNGRLLAIGIILAWLPYQRGICAEASPQSASFAAAADVLLTRCIECHNGATRSGGLDLSRGETIRTGGDSGPAVVPGDASQSPLLARIHAGEMPPAQRGQPVVISADELGKLTHWIDAGAPWPDGQELDRFARSTGARAGRDWWSLQPLIRPPIPHVAHPWTRNNPIDAFIQEKLAQREFEPAPAADRRTLLRRMTQDTTGLRPSRRAYEDFLSVPHADATPQLVERLLATPQFGERFARHWLDIVRYADTSGYERDQEKPFAWRYRDWVVAAFNADVAYDRFIVDQLAGDQRPQGTREDLIATGFLRLGTWNDEPNDPEEYQYERLEDMVHVTSTAFLGMTLKCARCHDHKFDPFLQTDYYRVAAAFWTGPIGARDREWLGGPSAAELGHNDLLGWTDTRPDVSPLRLLKNGDHQQPGDPVSFGSPSAIPWLGVAENDEAAPLHGNRLRLADWIADPRNPLTARVVVNRIWQAYFGTGLVSSSDNFGFLGDRPSHPELLDWLASELIAQGWQTKSIHRLILTSATYAQHSVHPREQEFAQRDAGNRLVWRANRRRLDAESLRDQLLQTGDQLDLRMGGRGFVPRLSAEALEGLSRKGEAWQPSEPSEQFRRGLYLFSQRSLLPPFLSTFDFVDTTAPCAKRDVTIVPTQALATMNGEFTHALSERVAADLMAKHVAQPAEDLIESVWWWVLDRAPVEQERAAAMRYLEAQADHFRNQELAGGIIAPSEHSAPDLQSQPVSRRGEVAHDADRLALASLCHALMNTNEFLFVD